MSHHDYALRQMAIEWGVTPMPIRGGADVEDLWTRSLEAAPAVGSSAEGDLVVITAGTAVNLPGTTNVIKVDVALAASPARFGRGNHVSPVALRSRWRTRSWPPAGGTPGSARGATLRVHIDGLRMAPAAKLLAMAARAQSAVPAAACRAGGFSALARRSGSSCSSRSSTRSRWRYLSTARRARRALPGRSWLRRARRALERGSSKATARGRAAARRGASATSSPGSASSSSRASTAWRRQREHAQRPPASPKSGPKATTIAPWTTATSSSGNSAARPRAFRRVVVRCPFGGPAVTEQSAYDDEGDPFPTTYYLTCRHLVAAIARLEAAGGVERWSEAAPREARPGREPRSGERRATRVSVQSSPRPDRAPTRGLARARHRRLANPVELKCLHAHAAFALAKPGYELGERILAEIDPLWPGRVA